MIFLLIANVITFAQELVTDRPDQTESSVTVPKRSLQIESGVIFTDWKENSFKIKQILMPTALFRYGVTNGIELRLVAQNKKLKNDSEKINGLSDLEIGTKVQVLKKEDNNTEIAFTAHLLLPTAKKELTNEKLGIVSKLAFSHAINNAFEIGYNIGYNNFGFDDGSITYSTVNGFSISDKISAYVQPYGEYSNFKELFLNADTGITYLLCENFQLDLSFGTRLNNNMKYMASGFSWQIPE